MKLQSLLFVDEMENMSFFLFKLFAAVIFVK